MLPSPGACRSSSQAHNFFLEVDPLATGDMCHLGSGLGQLRSECCYAPPIGPELTIQHRLAWNLQESSAYTSSSQVQGLQTGATTPC